MVANKCTVLKTTVPVDYRQVLLWDLGEFYYKRIAALTFD